VASLPANESIDARHLIDGIGYPGVCQMVPGLNPALEYFS